jgi:hypothetical protein
VPGLAIAVVHADKPVYVKGFGVREIGAPVPIDADTVFQLASVSKPLTATVIAGLVGDGTVTWDARTSDLDPAFRLWGDDVSGEVTLRDPRRGHRDTPLGLKTRGFSERAPSDRRPYLAHVRASTHDPQVMRDTILDRGGCRDLSGLAVPVGAEDVDLPDHIPMRPKPASRTAVLPSLRLMAM